MARGVVVRGLVLAVALLTAAAAAARGADDGSGEPPATAPAVDPAAVDRLRQTVGFLASDELEGRGVGTAGLNWAGDFIADRFADAGLKPFGAAGGGGDYFQPFDVTVARAVGKGTALRVGRRELQQGRDFIPLSFSAAGAFGGPVVFAGYGIARDGYDDYKDLDVRDKVVLVLRYEPHDPQGKSQFTGTADWSPDATLPAKARAAADRGARAVLLVNPPDHHGPDALIPFASIGGPLGATDVRVPFVQVSARVAADLLYRANLPTLRTLQARIDKTKAPASRALPGVTVDGRVDLDRTSATLRNVVGLLPATAAPVDAGGEVVVVGAHYDHLGTVAAPGMLGKPGQVHNGADDNASGTAALLELAQRLSAAPDRPRAVLFVAFSGEERGLLGSKHFVDHPPVPLGRVVAMLNLDMVGRVAHDTIYVAGHGTAAAFGQLVTDADARSPLVFKSIGPGGLGPSDHMPFALRQVPVLFLFTGLHMDYHRPTDDADRVNYTGLVQVVDFAADLVTGLMGMPRQAYVAAADKGGSPLSARFGPAGATRVTLGVVPDYAHDAQGCRVSGTATGSPAAAAGLRAGDVIVGFGERAVTSVYDLTAALAAAAPGDVVRLTVRRDDQTIDLTATLAERKGQ